jgi:hypothetical protein
MTSSGPIDYERLGLDDRDRFNPHILAEQIRLIGERRADARAAAELLEQTKHATLARLTNIQRAGDPDLSRKEAEDIALASSDFMAHLQQMVSTRKEADLWEARWKAVLALHDGIRTKEATLRAEMHRS